MLKALLSLWIIFSLAGPAYAQERTSSPGDAPQSGISLPPTLGSLKRNSIKKYDHPGLGVAYRYAGAQLVKGDVFIYDLGLKNLGTGLQSPQVRPHFEKVKSDIYRMGKSGEYQSIAKVSEGEISLVTPTGKIPALSATFTYNQVGQDSAYKGIRVSHLILTAYKNAFVKIRFTYPEALKEKGGKAWNQFLADFGKNLQ